ncbi:MAG: tRNA-binding protein [Candidatus ainarchaeum sp.]|nr:tRNA-binding protein [Candidatus ainarchaeum sp.]
MLTYEEFLKVDMRIGKIIGVEDFPAAKKPSYKLKLDLGPEIGIKASCSQLTHFYKKEELLCRYVVCVVNFPPKMIADFSSEVLTLGVWTDSGVVYLQPERGVRPGLRIS